MSSQSRHQQQDFHRTAANAIDEFIDRFAQTLEANHPCPYLPDRLAGVEAFHFDTVPAELYRLLLDRNFRRSGRLIYRAKCPSCNECRQLRVPVQQFAPSRSQRRVLRINRELHVETGPPAATEEKRAIFERYLTARHDGSMSAEWDRFVDFLYDTPVDSLEYCYYLGRRLVAVSICDTFADALSSVYAYFDPEFSRRSLGTFTVLHEIDDCRRNEMEYYYLGYYIRDCRTMEYKADFRPKEILIDHAWVPRNAPADG